MQFAFHLLDLGEITPDQFVEALRTQQQTLPPLGQLAIEERLLSARDVFKVLRVQSDFIKERFGETAVELDLLTRRDVASLLMTQADRSRPLAELLVENGAITQAACDRQYEAYRAAREAQGAARAVGVSRLPAAAAPIAATTDEPARDWVLV